MMQFLKKIFSGGGTFVCCFAVLIIFANSYMIYFINSDHASELMLSKLLAESGEILSDKWFYSTELRVLNIQLIFSPLFKLTNDWMRIRLVGTVILWLFLLLSAFFFGKSVGISKYISVLCLLLVVPYSEQYFLFVVMGTYYIPHLFIGFMTLGCLCQSNKSSSKYVRYICNLLNVVLAILAGMGGLRELFVLYVPLFAASLILFITAHKEDRGEKRRYLQINSFLLSFSFLGYFINTFYLSKIYSFQSFGNIKVSWFTKETLKKLLNGFLYFHGWRREKEEMMSSLVVCDITCVLLLITLFIVLLWYVLHWKELQSIHQILILLYVISGVMMVGLYLMTNMGYNHRYWILTLIWELPLVIIWYDYNKHPLIRCGLLGMLGAIVLSSLVIYTGYKNVENNLEQKYFLDFHPNNAIRKEMADYLVENGYYCGYATFWNANIMTELSNGQIEVWTLPEELENTEIYQWLQKREHAVSMPEDKCFYLFAEYELESPLAKSVKDYDILYENEGFVVYVENNSNIDNSQ